MVSATIMKSYCLCSSDPIKGHCKKMKGNLLICSKVSDQENAKHAVQEKLLEANNRYIALEF